MAYFGASFLGGIVSGITLFVLVFIVDTMTTREANKKRGK